MHINRQYHFTAAVSHKCKA